jgi:siroheme synthase
VPGKVHLVGAGPGSADLLTVRAAAVLRAAHVVLHDNLLISRIPTPLSAWISPVLFDVQQPRHQ